VRRKRRGTRDGYVPARGIHRVYPDDLADARQVIALGEQVDLADAP
jgi:hypothetical protein